jgi:hypothetical protein
MVGACWQAGRSGENDRQEDQVRRIGRNRRNGQTGRSGETDRQEDTGGWSGHVSRQLQQSWQARYGLKC